MSTLLTGIVSADDHVTAPRNVWSDRLPSRYKDVGPRVVRDSASTARPKNHLGEQGIHAEEKPADYWVYEDFKT